jgi:hypothetical protein
MGLYGRSGVSGSLYDGGSSGDSDDYQFTSVEEEEQWDKGTHTIFDDPHSGRGIGRPSDGMDPSGGSDPLYGVGSSGDSDDYQFTSVEEEEHLDENSHTIFDGPPSRDGIGRSSDGMDPSGVSGPLYGGGSSGDSDDNQYTSVEEEEQWDEDSHTIFDELNREMIQAHWNLVLDRRWQDDLLLDSLSISEQQTERNRQVAEDAIYQQFSSLPIRSLGLSSRVARLMGLSNDHILARKLQDDEFYHSQTHNELALESILGDRGFAEPEEWSRRRADLRQARRFALPSVGSQVSGDRDIVSTPPYSPVVLVSEYSGSSVTTVIQPWSSLHHSVSGSVDQYWGSETHAASISTSVPFVYYGRSSRGSYQETYSKVEACSKAFVSYGRSSRESYLDAYSKVEAYIGSKGAKSS